MIMTSERKDAYNSGDVITYKEKYSNLTAQRVCLTSGEWTGSYDMFSSELYKREKVQQRCITVSYIHSCRLLVQEMFFTKMKADSKRIC